MTLPQFQTKNNGQPIEDVFQQMQTRWATIIDGTFKSLTTATDAAANFGAGLFVANFGSSAGTEYWSLTSSSIADFTATGTPAFTSIFNSGFKSLAAIGGGLPGVTFLVPNTGTLQITAEASVSTAAGKVLELVLTDANNNILRGIGIQAIATNGEYVAYTLSGYLAVTAGNSFSAKLRAKVDGGTVHIGGFSGDYILSFQAEYAA